MNPMRCHLPAVSVVAVVASLAFVGCGTRKSDEKSDTKKSDSSSAAEKKTDKKADDKKADDKKADEKKTDDKKADDSAGGVMGIPECAAYLKRVEECKTIEGPMKGPEMATKFREELQKKIDGGSKPFIIKGACEAGDKAFKCK